METDKDGVTDFKEYTEIMSKQAKSLGIASMSEEELLAEFDRIDLDGRSTPLPDPTAELNSTGRSSDELKTLS